MKACLLLCRGGAQSLLSVAKATSPLLCRRLILPWPHCQADVVSCWFYSLYPTHLFPRSFSPSSQVLSQAGRYEAAFLVKDDMDAAGVAANVVTWTALIGACARAGFTSHGFRLFEEMIASGCVPSTATYNLLIHMCAQAGREDTAVALLREMEVGGRCAVGGRAKHTIRDPAAVAGGGAGEGAAASAAVSTGAAADSASDAAGAASGGASSGGAAAGASDGVSGKADLATTAGVAGSGDAGKGATDSLRGSTREADSTGWSAASGASSTNTVVDSSSRISSRGRQPVDSCSNVVSSRSSDPALPFARTARVAEAANRVGAVRYNTAPQPSCQPDTITYNSVIKACAANAPRARSLFEEMRGKGLQPDQMTFTALLDAHACAADLPAALQVRGGRWGGLRGCTE